MYKLLGEVENTQTKDNRIRMYNKKRQPDQDKRRYRSDQPKKGE